MPIGEMTCQLIRERIFLLLINFSNNQPSQNQSINMSYQTANSFHSKKKRIYSAKPRLQDSRRFTRGTQRPTQDSSILQLSPSDKKLHDSNFIRFSQHTAPSTDFQRSYYNPYQTLTKMSDNFLNIQRNPLKQNYFNNETTARTSTSNLSNMTHVQNNRTEDQLNALEKIREMHNDISQLSSLKHVDCGKLLVSATLKMKKMNYKLSSIVSNGELHVEVQRNDPREVEIFEDIPFLLKVGCKGLVGPAKFILKFKTRGKVKSYVSFDKSLGTNPKSSKKLTISDKPRFQIFPENNEKVFENEYIYCLITSITECKFELFIDFPNEDDKKRRKKEVKEEDRKEDIDAKLGKVKIMKPMRPKQDIVEENIRRITYWNRISIQERKSKSQKFQRRRQNALK